MTTNQKILGAFTDLDQMTFGAHQGKKMQDVPAKYLEWLWGQSWLKSKYPEVWGYIHNSKEAIEQELGHEI